MHVQLILLNIAANIRMKLALIMHCASDCFAFRFGKAVQLDLNFVVFIIV